MQGINVAPFEATKPCFPAEADPSWLHLPVRGS